MFLHMLNDDQKRAFAALALKLTAADGALVGREAAKLRTLAGEMNLDLEGLDSNANADVATLAAAFTDRRSKTVALLELFGFAYSDTSFQAVEQSIVAEVARAMNVSGDELKRLEAWVGQHVEHVRRAFALMRE
jgi:uncharacterized tellurite resistance protein B-like protein